MAFAAAVPALISGGIALGGSLYGDYREKKLARRQKERYGEGGLRPGEEKRFDRFNPEQQQVFQMLNNLLSGQGQQPGGLLGEAYGDKGFDAYADPEIRRFNEQTVPGLAERFSRLGSGAQGSSAFQNSLAQEGSNLSRDLAEMRSRRRQEGTNDLLKQSLQPQYHTRYDPQGPSGSAQAFSGLGKAGIDALIPALTSLIEEWTKQKGKGKQQGSYIDPKGNITGKMYS